ncbi:G-patch domain [Sesbania bispinosa]|nr:G-patch domain [Sesbania bispinosa]
MEENNLEGRNLSTEMDAMQGKISEMIEAQNRIEETLRAIKEAFGMLGVNATSGGGPSHSAQVVNNAGGEANPDPTQQLLRFVTPVKEGYQAIENPQMDSHGNVGLTWEQPHMFISGQQTGFRARNSQASIQKEAKEVWMEKMEEKIKAIQGPSTYGSLGIEELCHTMNVPFQEILKSQNSQRTLGSPYVGSMAGATYRDFADLIAAGEMIEILARAEKLPADHTENRKGPQSKKRELEVSLIQPQPNVMPQHSQSNPRYPTPSYNPNPCFPYQAPISPYIPNTNTTSPLPFQINNIPMPRPPTCPNYTYPQSRPYNPQPQSNFQNQGRFRQQNLPPFPKLSISNVDLFQRLFDAHLISENPVRPMEPPFPAWYNPNLTCKFHMGVAGHTIEDCEAFKTAVRKLIACGRLDIQEEKGPNIVNNPIPNHERGNQANAVEKEEVLIKKVLSLRTPMGKIFEGLKKVGYNVTIPSTLMKDEGMYDEESSCAYHDGAAGHDIENCWDFKVRVQGLITMGGHTSHKKDAFVRRAEKVVLTVKNPKPFAFMDTHTVPWNYAMKAEMIGDSSISSAKDSHAKEKSITNIVKVEGITRSGRYYGPEKLEEKNDNKKVSVPYVDNVEQEERNLCHSFEVIELRESSTRNVNQTVARIMSKNGYQEGKGLGSQLQGDKRPMTLPEKFDRLGLGYEKLVEGKFQAVTFKRKDKKSEVQRISHLRETFPAPEEVIMSEEAAPPRYLLTINTLDEEVLKECDVIRPSLDQEL